MTGALDVHSHILPGIDDGSPDMATSVAMARLAVAAGVTTMVGTPHWMEDEHETDPRQVRQLAHTLQVELDRLSIALAVLPGNEAFICPDLPDRVQQGDVLTLGDKGAHLLVELPYEDLPLYVDDVFFRLQVLGITPVLAHIERYAPVRENPDLAVIWSQRGILLQVNADTLTRAHGSGYDLVRSLMDQNIALVVASDAHDTKTRAPAALPWSNMTAAIMGAEE